MLVLIERWKCTKCSAACCVAADSYAVSQLPKIPTIDTWASELLHRPTEVGGLVWWITFCLTPCGQPGAFAWESRASWQRYCDAMENGVLRNLGSWHSCGHYFDMSHLAKIIPDKDISSWMVLHNGSGLFQDIAPYQTAKTGSVIVWRIPLQVQGGDFTATFQRSSKSNSWRVSIIKGSANVLAPDTTARQQRSCGVHA